MKPYVHEEIGTRQVMIMQCIWRSGEPLTVTEIIDMLEARCGQRLAPSTITTLCLSLMKKNYLKQGPKRSHAYTYEALISEEQYRKCETERFRELMFGGSAGDMVVAMLQEQEITDEDAEKIRKVLQEYEQ